MSADLSQEQQLALLPKEQRDAILAELDMDVLAYDWGYQGRPSQKLDLHDPWSLAVALAGRGFGKTLMGSQWIRQLDTNWQMLSRDQDHMRFCLLGRTAGDVRDVMLEGPSGLMNIWPPSVRDRVIWTPSRRRIELPNGSVGLCFSGEEPDQLRGPAFHCFPAGTMVRGERGLVPIEQLQVGDRVWTRAGLRLIGTASSKLAEVVTLHHAKGSLTGTPDHPLLTQRGWVPIKLITPDDKIMEWRENGKSIIVDGHTAAAKTTVSNGGLMSYGPSHMGSQYQLGTRYTTLTSTASMTAPRTSLRSLRRITKHFTEPRSSRARVLGATKISTSTRSVAMPSTAKDANESKIEKLRSERTPNDLRMLFNASTVEKNLLPELESIAVKGVSTSGLVTRVYNLEILGQPEYFADDILVHNCGWVDELAAFKQLRSVEGEATAWQNLRIGVRLGKKPQILATTTPKRVPVIKEILSEAADKPGQVLMRRGKTVDNKYLSSAYLDVLFSLYGGTALGRQELEGEVLDDVVGAMVSESAIEASRVTALPAGIPWIRLIGVDPSVAERPHDECGIVVVYISNTWPIERRHAFVVDDLSVRAAPAVWGKILVKAAYEHQATIIAETNQGSNLVQQLIRMSADDAGLPIPVVRDAWSSKSKAVRSEPVGAAYARGRVHHVNVYPDLESVLTSWVPGESGYSPDRMDALVHACAAGMFRRALVNGMPGSAAIRSSARDHLQIPKEAQNLNRRDVRNGLFVAGQR